MNINATLLIELVFFALFVWFAAAFVWPPIIKAIQEREQKIADGLDAATRAEKDLELAQDESKKQLRTAKEQAAAILEQSNKRAAQIVEQAKEDARVEAERILTAAQAEIEQEVVQAREALRVKVSSLAMVGAEKILLKEIDAASHKAMIDKLAAEL